MRKIFFLIFLGFLQAHHSFAQLLSEPSDSPAPAETLSQYLQFASQTGSEKQAGAYLANVGAALGLHVQVFTAEEDSYNFAASLYPLNQGKPNIILLNHIDVVPASETTEHWDYPPYTGMVTDSMIYGRGALDNKGAAVMQLYAVAHYIAAAQEKELPYNVTLLAVSSEETGGRLGAKIMSEEYFSLLNPAVILGEGGAGVSGILPSDAQKKIFGIEINHKSSLSLRLHLALRSSGHGSVPPRRYTNKMMVASLHKLMERKPKITFTEPARIMFKAFGRLEGGFKGLVLRHPLLFKPLLTAYVRKNPVLQALVTNTVTVTHIENPPQSPNQISQEITVVLDCRLLPGTDEEKFIRSLKRTYSNTDIEVEVLSKAVAAPHTNPENIFFEKLAAAVKTVYPKAAAIPILAPASNDNNYFRVQGAPVFGLTPIYMDEALLSSIHNSNERIPLRALHEGLAVYKDFLRRALNLDKQPADALSLQ
jgi:carboxypeptidase PM20D1